MGFLEGIMEIMEDRRAETMRNFLLGFVLIALCVQISAAYDLLPPSWRGAANTTFQGWEFDTPDNPAVLEPTVMNPYGLPELSIVNPFGMTNWLPSYNTGVGEESGIWKLYAGQLVLEIPNTENTAPDSFKEVWMQVTYHDPGGAGGYLPFVVDPVYTSINLEQRLVLDSGFYHDTYSIIIEPNPTHEQILISPIQCQLYVDEVVVDTICIPEPATLGLLGIGGMLLCRKRRA